MIMLNLWQCRHVVLLIRLGRRMADCSILEGKHILMQPSDAVYIAITRHDYIMDPFGLRTLSYLSRLAQGYGTAIVT